MNKQELRLLIGQKLKNLSQDEIDNKSKSVSHILFKFLSQLKIPNKLIGCYSPFKREVQWMKSASSDYHYAYPSVEGSEKMSFYLEGSTQIVYPKVLVIPGLAFSKNGRRLGRGKGYYDRYLSDKNILKIGICFNEQVVEEVQTDEHDVWMDYIINENTVFKGNE